jgi:ribosomal protein L11 methyltransferase
VRTAAAMPEAEWRDAWKRYFKVSHLTREFVVVPSWETYEAKPGEVIIDLDPGMAFGTGTHASTRLVLEELQALADAGTTPPRILDVGCGSGILSIAAVKRWPGATCVAVDNDPIAVQATAENVERNGVQSIVTTGEGSLGPGAQLGHWLGSDWAIKQRAASRADGPVAFEPEQEFDLIVANILANVHVLLAPHLHRALKAGGLLITSGIIADREADVAEAFAAAGLMQVERLQEGDWVALVHVRH